MMKLICFLFLVAAFVPMYAQKIKMIPVEMSGTEEFYQNKNGVFSKKSNERIIYPIPVISKDSIFDSLVIYEIGKDMGINDKSEFTVGCYELDFENEMKKFKLSIHVI